MRAGYQTVPSSRTNTGRRRGQRLGNRNQANPRAPEHSTQSQENLGSPRPSPTQIPRPSDRQKSPMSRSRPEFDRAKSPSPRTKTTPGPYPEAVPKSPHAEHEKRETTPEIPSPLTVVEEKTVEPVIIQESPGDTLDVDNSTTAEDSVPPLDLAIPAEGDEHLRAVSCTSTVFFDAPGTLASQSDSLTSIENRSAAVMMPNLDGLIDNFADQQCHAQTRPEPERTVSSNYSNSATLPSPGSPGSPTTPRSPVLAPEAMREELTSDVETMRQRLFSHSSDIFKSSTWEQNSDLDLATLGRGGHIPGDVEARQRATSEESTVIEGDRSVHLQSRVTSVNGAQVIAPIGRISGQSARADSAAHWHDGPADGSAAASDAHPLGPQPSVTETCTITSTQAIKSRTFSSANDSEYSGLRGSGEMSIRTGDGAASVKPASSAAKDPEKQAGAASHSATSAEGPTNDDDGEVEAVPIPPPLVPLIPIIMAAAMAVKKLLTFCLPVPLAIRLAEATGLKKKKDGDEDGNENENEDEAEAEAGTLRRSRLKAFWRRRGSTKGPQKKRSWRVRIPWGWRRREELPPLLAGGSTEG